MRSLAHQNPPRPDDIMTNALAEDDTGVMLRKALTNARAERAREVKISMDLALNESLLPNNRAKSSEDAHIIPENTLALSPGNRVPGGIRNAR